VESCGCVLWVLIACPGKPIARGIQPSPSLLLQPKLKHGGNVSRVVGEKCFELGDRLIVSAEAGVRASQLPASVSVVWLPACLLP
jgi:hypothetical protein